MLIALIAVVALGAWMHARGELLPALRRWGAVAALALVAARMLETGKPLFAAVVGAAALFWWYAARGRTLEVRGEGTARTLLGVTVDADAEAIHAAWRRGLTQAHPDAGGSADAVQRLTAARDLLLARQRP